MLFRAMAHRQDLPHRSALFSVPSSVSDAYAAKAISAMTNDPGRPWTVAMLGRIVGLSRAAFARRFAASVGMAPRTWLTRHRLHLAQQQLVHTDAGLAALATRLGYASEFAFAKAFKRIVGVAPGQFRRLARRTAQNPAFLPRAAA